MVGQIRNGNAVGLSLKIDGKLTGIVPCICHGHIQRRRESALPVRAMICLLYTSDAADE